jgi:hypothetical protein
MTSVSPWLQAAFEDSGALKPLVLGAGHQLAFGQRHEHGGVVQVDTRLTLS